MSRNIPPFVVIVSTFVIFAAGYGLAVFTLPGRVADTLSGRFDMTPPAGWAKPDAKNSAASTHATSKSADHLIELMKTALLDPSATNRGGNIWLLTKQINKDNAQAVADALGAGPPSTRQQLTPVLEAWARVDPRAALAFTDKLKGWERRWAANSVIASWALEDFAGTDAWVKTLPPGNEKNWAEKELLRSRATQDPDGLLRTMIADRRNAQKYEEVVSDVFTELTNRNPRHAAEAIESLPDSRMRFYALSQVASIWSIQDPEAAMDWLNTLPAWASATANSSPRQQAQSNIISNWARQDFAGAMKWIGTQPAGADRDALISRIGSQLAGDDPENAVATVEMLSSMRKQNDLVREIATSWAHRDPKATQAWAESQTDPAVRKAAIDGLVNTLADDDPSAAAPIALSLPAGNARTDAISSLARRWSVTDPSAAAAWALKLPEGDARRNALQGIAQNWARSDPPAALQWATSNLPDAQKAYAFANIADQWARIDPAAAGQWATRLPEAQRAGTVAQIARTWSANDPAAASKWVAQISDEKTRAEATSRVAGTWASSDPAGASQWVARMPDDPVRLRAIDGLMESWIPRSPDNAQAWFASLPPFANRDATIQRFIGSLASQSPALAIQLSETVANQSQKNSSLEQVARFWMHKDPPAARAWIEKSELPETTRQRLLAEPKR